MTKSKESKFEIDLSKAYGSPNGYSIVVIANENSFCDVFCEYEGEKKESQNIQDKDQQFIQHTFPFCQNEKISRIDFQPNEQCIISITIFSKDQLDQENKQQYELFGIQSQKQNPEDLKPVERLVSLQNNNEQIEKLVFHRKGKQLSNIEATFNNSTSITGTQLVNLKSETQTIESSSMCLSVLNDNAVSFAKSFLPFLELAKSIPYNVKSEKFNSLFTKLEIYLNNIVNLKMKIQQQMSKTGRTIDGQIIPVLDCVVTKIQKNLDKNMNLKRYKPSDYADEQKDLESFKQVLNKLHEGMSELNDLIETAILEGIFITQVQKNMGLQKTQELILLYNKDTNELNDLIQAMNQLQKEKEKLERIQQKQNQDQACYDEQFQYLNSSIKTKQQQINELQKKQQEFSEQVLSKEQAIFHSSDVEELKQKLENINLERNNKLESLLQNYQNESQQLTDKINILQNDVQGLDNIKRLQNIHIILVLDESGSMSGFWVQVIEIVKMFVKMFNNVEQNHLVSIVTFNSDAKILTMKKLPKDTEDLPSKPRGGGTKICPAIKAATNLVEQTSQRYTPIIIMMTDAQVCEQWSQINETTKLLSQEAQGTNLMLFTIGFGIDYDRETLQKLSKKINGDIKTKIRQTEINYCLDARDSRALNETFVSIANVLLDTWQDDQIKDLNYQQILIKENYNKESSFFKDFFDGQQATVKQQAELFQKLTEEDNKKCKLQVSQIIDEQLQYLDNDLQKEKQELLKFIEQNSKQGLSDLNKPSIFQLDDIQSKINNNQKNQDRLNFQNKEKQLELIEQTEQNQQQAGFFTHDHMQKFEQYLYSPVEVLGSLQRSTQETLTFLLKTNQVIEKFSKILREEKKIEIDDDVIMLNLRKKYQDDIDFKGCLSNDKQTLSKVLEFQLPEEFTEHLQGIYDDIFEQLNIRNLLNMDKDEMTEFIDEYLGKLSPIDPTQDFKRKNAMKKIKDSDSDDSDEDCNEKKKRNKINNQKSFVDKETATQNPQDNHTGIDHQYYLDSCDQKKRFATVQATEEHISGLMQTKQFMNTKCKKLRLKKKGLLLLLKESSDPQIKSDLKKQKEKINKKITEKNYQMQRLDTKAKFYEGTLNPKILKRNIERLLRSIATYTKSSIQNAVIEQVQQDIKTHISSIKQTLQNLPIFRNLTKVFSLSSPKEINEVLNTLNDSQEQINMIAN